MSEETEETPIVEEETIEVPPKKQKNPERVKQGLKLADIGQKAKEEKMRKRVKDEMYKPTTWMGLGAALSSVALLSFWYFSSSKWKK